jgi:pyrroline-5-carboxylate reductase
MELDPEPAVGFIGVGEIAAAMVDGLCAGTDTISVYLSPRGADTGAALARRYPQVQVCALDAVLARLTRP